MKAIRKIWMESHNIYGSLFQQFHQVEMSEIAPLPRMLHCARHQPKSSKYFVLKNLRCSNFWISMCHERFAAQLCCGRSGGRRCEERGARAMGDKFERGYAVAGERWSGGGVGL
jgi:hypothetical protein